MANEGVLNTIKTYSGRFDYRFLIFLFISTLLWVSMQVSKTNIQTYDINVNYIVPDAKLMEQGSDQKIIVKLKAKTWNLLNSNRFSEDLSISLQDKYNQVVSETTLYNMLKEYIGEKYEIVNVIPSSLAVTLVDPAKVKVPVFLKGKIEPKAGFSLINQLKLIPDSITVMGTAEDIKDIKMWFTSITLNSNLDKDVDQLMDLESTNSNNSVAITPRQVRVQMEIDQLAEKSFKRKIIPSVDTGFYSIPAFSLVKLSIPLRAIDKIRDEDIKVRLENFNKKDTINKYKLVVEELPHNSKILQITPDSVTVFRN